MPRFADVCVITTLDRLHHAPALEAIDKGYNILLEKPVSSNAKECIDIANAAKKKSVKILVCHVLRYTPFFMTIKNMINEGKLGRVISIHHSECVGNTHQSHSFVRGNWGNSDKSSSMILQKSCHDMDIIQWLIGKPCKKVQSFGSLTYFTKENAPEGSPERCDKSCPVYDTCYYNAHKLYIEDETNEWFRGVVAKKAHPTNEEVQKGLDSSQYGKCVFKCDNNVVDHQVVNLEFEGGEVASFNMSAFNKGGRYIRIMGTDGEIYGEADTSKIKYFDFKTREKTIVDTNKTVSDSIVHGHGGGDSGIINTLYEYIVNDYSGDQLSEIAISTQNHLIAFAAEKSRIEEKIIDLNEYSRELGLE